MVILISIGKPDIRQLTVLSEALVKLNMIQMKRSRIPALYESGVRYSREAAPARGPRHERFQTAAQVLRNRKGDCEDLAAYRVAELRLRGIAARPWVIRASGRVFHVQVRYPDGRIEDPSARLGMRGSA